jgi:SagB-type dehydrogenase family enzyme
MLDEHLRLRADAGVTAAANGDTLLTARSGRGASLKNLTAGQRAALRALGSAEQDLSRLVAEAAGMDGWAGLANVHSLLEVLRVGNWLRAALLSAGRLLAVLVPSAAPGAGTRTWQTPLPRSSGAPDDDALVLSRFALLRRVGAELVLESPQARATLQVSAPEVAALLGRLARPLIRTDATEVGPWAPELLDVLVREGFVVPEHSSEDSDFHRLQWAPHELWFHVGSSIPGRTADQECGTGAGWGGTSWAEERFPPPAARVCGGGSSIRLPRPDLSSRAADDPTFTQVLETRRSIREHDDSRPIDAPQVGEFLFRTARTRGVRRPGAMEVIDRPYPSGGGLHELQLYVVAVTVPGVEPGMYRYDGWDHALELVAPFDADVRMIARHAAAAIRMNGLPQIVFVISARFGRTMWKYQSMAYALVLKNVGVLIGAMYLVAAAMHLAPCAVGSGGADLFSRVTGLDPLVESVVGVFTLGSALPDAYTRGNKGE